MPAKKFKADIRNCQFAFRCARTWDSLQHSDEEGVRYCSDCRKHVHFCETDQDLVEAIKMDWCVAIDSQNEAEAESSEVSGDSFIGAPSKSPYLIVVK